MWLLNFTLHSFKPTQQLQHQLVYHTHAHSSMVDQPAGPKGSAAQAATQVHL